MSWRDIGTIATAGTNTVLTLNNDGLTAEVVLQGFSGTLTDDDFTGLA